MILKKPYAFLIKYFRIIHFIISSLAIFIAYKSYKIVYFFNEYISNNYTGNYYEGFVNSYISPIVYLALIFILFFICGIYLLFIYKKKPTKMYVFSGIYYIVFIIYLIIIKKMMITLETSVITAETARLLRDISIIMFIPQTFLAIMFIFRSFGFNLQKFEFDKDIKELKIEESDNEEVEVTFKNDSVKLKRNFYRFIREFKYYIKENKFMVTIICIILLIVIAFLIYKSLPEIIDNKYNQGDSFIIDNLTYKIEDSIITNLNYNGDLISEDKYYLVLRLNITNNSNKNIELDYNNFRLVLNKNYIYPSIDKGKNFIDYAKDNYNTEIKGNSNNTYSLVYIINESDLKKNYEVKITNGSVIKDEILIGKHNYIKITPIIIDKKVIQKEVNINEEINFINSNLGNTILNLYNPIITDKYVYNYEYCFNGICKTYKDMININYTLNNNILIVMDYKYEIDKTVPFYTTSSNINTFISTFMKIRYKDNLGEIKYLDIKDVTPNKLKDKIVVETSNIIQNSDIVELSFIIRNKEYIVKIK